MKTEALIGIAVENTYYGIGVISRIGKTPHGERVTVTFEKGNAEKVFDFPNTLLDKRYFKLDNEASSQIRSCYVFRENGTRVAREDLEAAIYKCVDCGKKLDLPMKKKEWLFQSMKRPYCTYCLERHKAMNRYMQKQTQMQEIRSLMMHPMKRSAKKNQPHDTDGMGI